MTTLIPWWKNMPATHRQIMKIGMNSKMFCLKTNNGIKVTIDISIIILCGTSICCIQVKLQLFVKHEKLNRYSFTYCALNILSNSSGPVTLGGSILYFIRDCPTCWAYRAKMRSRPYIIASQRQHKITYNKPHMLRKT